MSEPIIESPAEGRLQLGLAGGGAFRWAVVDITEVVEEARFRLDLSPVAAAALGRALAGSALLLRLATKTPSRLVVEVSADGPLRRVIAEADDEGNLRGMVGNARVDVPATPEGKLAVGRAVGRGRLQVLREHPGGSYQSQVELVSGEIGADLTHYLAQSEQTRSAVLLGVLARTEGITGAGGMIIEVLPGAEEEVIAALEGNIGRAGGVSRLVEEGGVGTLLDAVLRDLEPEVREERPLRYRCRCSRQRLLRHLVLLPRNERLELAEADGSIAAECAFCGTEYRLPLEELEAGETPVG